MAYDMDSEAGGADQLLQCGERNIQHASAYITISDNTARDLVKFSHQNQLL